jgi:peroxiredoxin
MKFIVLGIVAAMLSLSAATGLSFAHNHAAAPATVGKAAPAWTLQDQDGKTHNLADFKGKIVVLEWFNNECPFVVKHYKNGDMNKLAAKYTDKGVVWLAVNSTNFHDNAHNTKVAADWNMGTRRILNDQSGEVGKAYGARTTPHMYIVDKDGVLAYAGAIDSKSGSDSAEIATATNYVAAALDQLLAGESVVTAETKPYGCSVKYKK